MTFEQLLDILSDLHPEVDFAHEQHLIDDRILTSFDVVAIAAELMEGYGVELTAADILPENFNSAHALFALIKRLEQGA